MPATKTAHLAHFNLKVGGSQAPQQVMDQMLDCTVENSLHLPDVCTLRIHDAGFHWLDAQTFREGTRLQVIGGQEPSSEPDSTGLLPLFDGEVVAIELDLAAHGVPTLVVRCFDRSHRLHRGRYSRSFVQMTDTDIVNKIASELEFTVHADSTPEVHDWVLQNNQTNWEFLSERAGRNGFRLYVQGEKDLYFQKVKDQGEATVTLEWGLDLRSFRPRVTAAPQVNEVTVRGWDPKTKQTIIGRSEKPNGIPQIRESTPGGDVAKKAYGAAKMVVVDRPVHSQREADDLARSICDDIGGSFIEADGLCYGRPNLRAGDMVKIENIGERFSGQYQVTASTQTYSAAEGYSTLFSVSGKHPATLLALLHEASRGTRSAVGGNIVIGVVTDNQDPDDLGRVKVKYPWLTEDHTSFWARLSAPMAGPGRGFYYIPEIDDEVLVAFEHGEISRPYIIGALWNGKDKPIEGNSQAVSGGKVVHRIIKTRIGHLVFFDDTDGKGEMRLKTANDHLLVLDDKNQNITAKTKSGHKLFLDDDGDQIIVQDKTGMNKITIKTGDNSIKAECMGDFTVDAKGKVTIQGMQGIDVTTPMQVKVEGIAGVDVTTTAILNLQATGPATLQSAAVVTVQGSLVTIN